MSSVPLMSRMQSSSHETSSVPLKPQVLFLLQVTSGVSFKKSRLTSTLQKCSVKKRTPEEFSEIKGSVLRHRLSDLGCSSVSPGHSSTHFYLDIHCSAQSATLISLMLVAVSPRTAVRGLTAANISRLTCSMGVYKHSLQDGGSVLSLPPCAHIHR